MAAPVPALSVTFCREVTGLCTEAALGGASDLPLQAALSAMQVNSAILGMFIDAMDGIIMEFAAARVQATPRKNAAHTAQVAALPAIARPISSLQPMANSRNAPTASSTSSTTCSTHSMPPILGAWLTINREWVHNLSFGIGLPWCLGLRRLYGHAAHSRPEP